MKGLKHFCIVLILCSSFSFASQTVKDTTITDLSGKTHHLYEYLDAGKYVVLGFGYTTCPNCWTTVNPYSAIYDKYNQNKGDVVVLYVNTTNVTVQVIANYISKYNIKYPVINNGASIASQFDFQYVPWVFVIKPDRSYIGLSGTDVQIAMQMANVPDPNSQLKLSTPSNDLLTSGTWLAGIDTIGSTIDTTGGIVQDGIAKVKFNIVVKEGAGAFLGADFSSAPEKKPVLKIEYKSTAPLYVELYLDKYSSYDTSCHEFDLAASAEWKTKLIRMDSLDLYQYSVEPKDKVPFDISKLFSILFVSAQPGEQQIEIKELKLYNVENAGIRHNASYPGINPTQLCIFDNHISFSVGKSGHYLISILNVNGRCVQNVTNQYFSPGMHAVQYSSNKLSNGAYLVELNSNQGRIAKHLLITH